MNRTLIATVALVGATCLGTGAWAQPTSNPAPDGSQGTLHRDIHQQERIEQGLQDGTITTRESAELERDQARVNELQSRALRNGTPSPSEQSELHRLQDRTSRDIHQAVDNGVNGNPMSASSQRAQADVQRNINQQERIRNGIHDGSLTAREASRMEYGQSRLDQREYAMGRDGHIGAYQQHSLQRQDNAMSSRIYSQRHDQQHRH